MTSNENIQAVPTTQDTVLVSEVAPVESEQSSAPAPVNTEVAELEQAAVPVSTEAVADEQEKSAATISTEAPASKSNVEDRDSKKEIILRQIEYYFSDLNLPTDEFMLAEIEKNEERFMKFDILFKFNKMKPYMADPELVAEAIEGSSSLIELGSDRRSVRRVTPLPTPEELSFDKERAIYIKGFPKTGDFNIVRSEINEFLVGYLKEASKDSEENSVPSSQQISSIILRTYRDKDGSSKLKGSVYTVFSEAKYANSFIKLFEEKPVNYLGSELKAMTSLDYDKSSIHELFDKAARFSGEFIPTPIAASHIFQVNGLDSNLKLLQFQDFIKSNLIGGLAIFLPREKSKTIEPITVYVALIPSKNSAVAIEKFNETPKTFSGEGFEYKLTAAPLEESLAENDCAALKEIFYVSNAIKIFVPKNKRDAPSNGNNNNKRGGFNNKRGKFNNNRGRGSKRPRND